MKKLLLSVLVITGLLTVNAQTAHACSCMIPGSPLEEMERSSFVFSGTAIEVEADSTIGDLNPLGYTVTFEVIESWKGVESSKVTVHTAADSAACGFPFEEGKDYIVYASELEDGIQVYSCGLTSLLADANVSELGEGTTVFSKPVDRLPEESNLPYIVFAVILTAVTITITSSKHK